MIRHLLKADSLLLMNLLIPFPVAAQHPESPMTVCAFVQQIKALNGRIVSVRGVLQMFDTAPDGATPESLIARCPELKEGVVTVRVEYPDVWFLKKPPKGYRVDKSSFRRAYKIVMSTLKDGRVKGCYIGTIRGQAYPGHPDSAPPPGIHLPKEGTYDAGIVIEGIYDLKIPSAR